MALAATILINPNPKFHATSPLSNTIHFPISIPNLSFNKRRANFHAISENSDTVSSESSSNSKPRTRTRREKSEIRENKERTFPKTIPKKPRRGRKSEAAAFEDFMRDSLEKTFAEIRKQNSDVLRDKGSVIKEKVEEDESDDGDVDGDEGGSGEKKMVVEEENPDWPLDADVGWGIRASEYFEQHPIKNVVGEDGVEIDWEGEMDDNLVKEINCLEWERFAFHPSPLIVLVFERYNRASDNWKILKELEKAAKVYWAAKDRLPPRVFQSSYSSPYSSLLSFPTTFWVKASDNWKILKELEKAAKVYWAAKDRLPPRTVKIDINIERDMAYALKVKECPQILFLRGNRILYREPQIRTSDELVQMIAHFYYNARKPSWMPK